MSSLLHQAHALLRTRLKNGDFAIDATVGNGHDTVFLAQQVASSGWVYGFDIQKAALTATYQRLAAANLAAQVQLVHSGHQFMNTHILAHHHGGIKAIMFNLGYLPQGDKAIISQADTTLIALNAAKHLLCTSGILTILAYPGHQGGDIETAQVAQWCEQLPTQEFALTVINSSHDKPSAPRLFVVEKI
jgi:predicted methyltransferase